MRKHVVFLIVGFDIHNATYMGAQAHGVRVLRVVSPLLEVRAASH